jgi:hypothetical protein
MMSEPPQDIYLYSNGAPPQDLGPTPAEIWFASLLNLIASIGLFYLLLNVVIKKKS